HEAQAEADSPERLGEPRAELGLRVGRRSEVQATTDERPWTTEDRPAGAEQRADTERHRDEGDDDREVEGAGDRQEHDREAGAEAMAARVDESDGYGRGA